jgi:hypothetical protein
VVAVVVDDVHTDARQRHLRAAGFVSVTPGSAETMIAPVSVCHHVSTIGAASAPMISRYHIHASGLMGSPTEPSRRIEDRSNCCGIWRPSFMNERIAVGAV